MKRFLSTVAERLQGGSRGFPTHGTNGITNCRRGATIERHGSLSRIPSSHFNRHCATGHAFDGLTVGWKPMATFKGRSATAGTDRMLVLPLEHPPPVASAKLC